MQRRGTDRQPLRAGPWIGIVLLVVSGAISIGLIAAFLWL